MRPSVVVFDIGGVLVDWRPHEAWMDELGSFEAVDAFMNRVDFKERNRRADAGERFADLAGELDDPQDADRLRRYVGLYAHTVREAVPGTWGIVDRLKARNVPLHAITNWSAETWPEGLKAHPRLRDVFGMVVVSGEVGMSKPDAAIFAHLCAEAQVDASDCVFIDDAAHNVAGAKSAGMDAIHFTGADTLEQELRERDLL